MVLTSGNFITHGTYSFKSETDYKNRRTFSLNKERTFIYIDSDYIANLICFLKPDQELRMKYFLYSFSLFTVHPR